MTVYLHIGAPKTGTTYLQRVLARNRRTLTDAGVYYPGSRPDHWFAAQDLLNWDWGGWHNPQVDGAWNHLVDQVHRWNGPTIVISHEMFSAAKNEHVARASADLGPDLHVIYTARDLARLIPAAWQEDVKNRCTATFPEALASLRNGGAGYPRTSELWRRQDTATVLDRWSAELPLERIHVVTTPKGGPPELLWQRFAGVIGIDPDDYEAAVQVNQSLGIGEVELLRRLNLTLGRDEMSRPTYSRVVKRYLAHKVLVPAAASNKVALPAEDHEWVTQWSRERAAQLRERGYHVVGELSELIPDQPAAGVQEATEAEVAHAGVVATAGLVRRLAAVREERDAALATVREHRNLPPRERVKRLVIELAGESRGVAAALSAYRRIRSVGSRAFPSEPGARRRGSV